jgi:glycerophosphoryl diester phosphodiesterase
MRRALALAFAATLAPTPLVAGCSSGGGAAPPPQDAGADAPAPLYDPSLFDCRALAKPPLPRRAASTPECLRDAKCKTRLVAGHRGAGGNLGRIAPEDTLSAYRAAIALGADFVETDPRPTKDGVLVNLHDDTVDRTLKGTGAVDQMTYDELRRLEIATQLPGDFACERVPTLKEVLETSRGRAMVLVDANKTDRVDLLVKAMQEADALEWSIFDTSDLKKIDDALAIEPRLLIMPRIRDEKDAPAILAKYKDHLPVIVEISQGVFPRTADLVHAAGSRVLTDVFLTDASVMFGDSNARYLEFYDRGADILQTDLPDEVLKAIGRKVPP